MTHHQDRLGVTWWWVFWVGIVLVGNCPSGELSGWGIVLVGNCPGGGVVLVEHVLMESCPSGKFSWWVVVLVRNCPGGELSWWEVVLEGNCPGGEYSYNTRRSMVRCVLTNFHSPMFHLPQAAWMFLSQVCCFCPHLDKNLVLQTWRTLTSDLADRSLTSDTGTHGSVTPEVLTSVLSVMGSLASAFAEDERTNLAEEITTRLVNVLEAPNIIGAMVETMYKVLCLQCIFLWVFW